VDYRIWALVALFGWGVWGFMSKLLTRDMSAAVLAFWSNIGSLALIVAYVVVERAARWQRNAEFALVAGVFAGIATVAFYIAVKNGPGSVVFPLTGMYILIPALLGFILLREPVTASHVVGIACAGAAIFFLSR
jgi:transporter family protein